MHKGKYHISRDLKWALRETLYHEATELLDHAITTIWRKVRRS
jgi:hypothetical protein